ncbi:unnamed protein product [Vitrella brassicaformis CCMP3155]|uniref:Rubredoxin-like domain-containing protein n=2 Tax=Vitrella brassicaformis TaxID=1169539 RepID=A0A0G4EEM1_VITBC|nr:unnamed protein product [Vitrella brassicaformis CCMP3155]|eukprot:CEL93822.1 unnamed protein product [Vitrella brassicaformis CCMP3155]
MKLISLFVAFIFSCLAQDAWPGLATAAEAFCSSPPCLSLVRPGSQQIRTRRPHHLLFSEPAGASGTVAEKPKASTEQQTATKEATDAAAAAPAPAATEGSGEAEGAAAKEPEIDPRYKGLTPKQIEVLELKEKEKFITESTGDYQCRNCGYVYRWKQGDGIYLKANTKWEDVPTWWKCPNCKAPKNYFNPITRTIAGFADNQGYGIGTNTLTAGQKNVLIFGSLGLFFLLFLSGYLLE